MGLKIISPIPPSVNNYLNYKVDKNPRNGRLFVKAYKSGDSVKYENTFKNIVKQAVNLQNWNMPEKDKYIIIRATFYFPKHGMDINNHWKLPLDVFKWAGVYHDDSKVIEGARRLYVDAKNPRIEFEIWESPFLGVFDSVEDFEGFKNMNCRFCKKKPERCATITKALENRITGDIDIENLTCNVRKPKVT
jgi:Holliday junction resolvase RusA-like endonuclease